MFHRLFCLFKCAVVVLDKPLSLGLVVNSCLVPQKGFDINGNIDI